MGAFQRTMAVIGLLSTFLAACGCEQATQPTLVDLAVLEARVAALEGRIEQLGKRQTNSTAIRGNAPLQPSTATTRAIGEQEASAKLATSIVSELDDEEREFLAIRLQSIAEGKGDQINRGPTPGHFSSLTGGQCEEIVLAAEWRSLLNNDDERLRWAAQKFTKRAALRLSQTTRGERARCMQAVQSLMQGQPDVRSVRFLDARIGPEPYIDSVFGKRAPDPDLVAKLAKAIVEAKAELQ